VRNTLVNSIPVPNKNNMREQVEAASEPRVTARAIANIFTKKTAIEP
jgi:hypothetical protein